MANNEGWRTSRNANGTLQYDYSQNMLFGGSTASLNDNVYIALLTDYHVYSAQKDYIETIDYTSNQRRWTITLNGQPVGEPLITDNPRHGWILPRYIKNMELEIMKLLRNSRQS